MQPLRILQRITRQKLCAKLSKTAGPLRPQRLKIPHFQTSPPRAPPTHVFEYTFRAYEWPLESIIVARFVPDCKTGHHYPSRPRCEAWRLGSANSRPRNSAANVGVLQIATSRAGTQIILHPAFRETGCFRGRGHWKPTSPPRACATSSGCHVDRYGKSQRVCCVAAACAPLAFVHYLLPLLFLSYPLIRSS